MSAMMARSTSRHIRLAFCFGLSLIVTALLAASPAVHATKYGAGSYGRCQYQTCSITISSSANVSINAVPSSSTPVCTTASDTVTVTTSSSTGYTLTLGDTDTVTNLVSGSNTIVASSATYASPATLGTNQWGYRVDSSGSFGAGPTSAQSNAATPAVTFAGVKPSSSAADTIKTSTSAASGGAATTVWYGICVNTTAASGAYSDNVLYTAVIN